MRIGKTVYSVLIWMPLCTFMSARPVKRSSLIADLVMSMQYIWLLYIFSWHSWGCLRPLWVRHWNRLELGYNKSLKPSSFPWIHSKFSVGNNHPLISHITIKTDELSIYRPRNVNLVGRLVHHRSPPSTPTTSDHQHTDANGELSTWAHATTKHDVEWVMNNI